MSTKNRVTAFALALVMSLSAIVPNIALAAEKDLIENESEYSVKLNQSDKGSINFEDPEIETDTSDESVVSARFSKGDDVSIIITPSEGYQAVSYDLTDLETEEKFDSGDIEENTVNFEMPAHDVAVDIGFAEAEEEETAPDETTEFDEDDSGSDDDISDDTDEREDENQPVDAAIDSEDETESVYVLMGTADELASEDEDVEERVSDIKAAMNKLESDENGNFALSASAVSMKLRAMANTNSKIQAKLDKSSNRIVHWSRWFKRTWTCARNEKHREEARQFSRHKLNGEYAYCIQPYEDSTDQHLYTEHDKEDFDGNVWGTELRELERLYVQRVVAFGYPNYDYNVDKCAAYVATQALCWECAMGMRTTGFVYKDSSSDDLYKCIYETADEVNWGSDSKAQFKKDFKKAYDGIVENVQRSIKWSKTDKYVLSYIHETLSDAASKKNVISFTDDTVEKDIKNDAGKVTAHVKSYKKGDNYYIELTDPHDVKVTDNDGTGYTSEKYYYWTSSYLTLSAKGNTVTIKCPTSNIDRYKSKQYITFRTDLVDIADYTYNIWEKANEQTLITYAEGSPVTGYLYLKYQEAEDETGYLRIKKVDKADANVNIGGATYWLYTDSTCKTRALSTNGKKVSFATLSSGYTTPVQLDAGTYYLKEQDSPIGYFTNGEVIKCTVNKNHTTSAPLSVTVTEEKGAPASIVKRDKDQSGIIVAGARYGMFTDSSCSEDKYVKTTEGGDAIFETTATGSNKVYVKPGKYYIKEIEAPEDGTYILSDEVIPVTVEKDKENVFTVTDKRKSGKAQIVKTSTTNEKTVVSGAEYTIYTDAAHTQIAKDYTGKNAVIITTATGSNVVELAPGTYYAYETKAPANYAQDKTAHQFTVVAGQTQTLSLKDAPKAYVTLKKTSANPSLTDGNSCYSLEGAVYKVYSDAACTKEVGTLTTKADGSTNTISVDAGKYFVKEIKASKGYMICETCANSAHPITVTAGQTGTVACKEPPGDDPLCLTLSKIDNDTTKNEAQGIASLEGAIFELDYYNNMDGNTSGTPFKKWYFQTDSKGGLRTNDESYLVKNLTLANGTVLKSAELYRNLDGQVVDPLGSYVLKEIVPPKYYQLNGTMKFTNAKITSSADVKTGMKFLIAQDSNGKTYVYKDGTIAGGTISAENMALNIVEKIYKGSIKLIKYDMNGISTLEGVTFKLVGDDGTTYTKKTDANGEITFDNLIPQHYVLTETSTLDGYDLMKDNVDITIPLMMTEKEIAENKADKSKAVWDEMAQAYCFYNQTYEIKNTPEFVMPTTGGSSNALYVGLAAAIGMICGCMVYMFRRKRAG